MQIRLARFFASKRTKNYYEILGVQRTDSSIQIKKRFIDLAKQLHPDIDPKNTERFKEINEAYSVLSKDSQRQEYDQLFDGYMGAGKNEDRQSAQTHQYQNFYNYVC